MNGPALNTDPRDPVAEELHLMKTAGIAEIASRNPNVADWIQHWEERALKAEAAVESARDEERAIWVSAIEAYFDATAVFDVEHQAGRIRAEKERQP